MPDVRMDKGLFRAQRSVEKQKLKNEDIHKMKADFG
jgi:hypothetical protein